MLEICFHCYCRKKCICICIPNSEASSYVSWLISSFTTCYLQALERRKRLQDAAAQQQIQWIEDSSQQVDPKTPVQEQNDPQSTLEAQETLGAVVTNLNLCDRGQANGVFFSTWLLLADGFIQTKWFISRWSNGEETVQINREDRKDGEPTTEGNSGGHSAFQGGCPEAHPDVHAMSWTLLGTAMVLFYLLLS